MQYALIFYDLQLILAPMAGRPARQRGEPYQEDCRRRVRGPGEPAEGHPPAAEEEAKPEQTKPGVPEPPDAVVSAASLVQKGRDVRE